MLLNTISNILSKYSRALNLSKLNLIFLFKLAVLQMHEIIFAFLISMQSNTSSFVNISSLISS